MLSIKINILTELISNRPYYNLTIKKAAYSRFRK